MKNKWWLWTKKTKDLGYSYEVKEKMRFAKGSVIAIILGLIGAMVIVSVQNVNPFSYLAGLFGISFGSLYINETFQWISIYLIAGLAIAISFKSGSFNIGVAGQMTLGAALAIIYVKKTFLVEPDHPLPINAGHVIIILLITVVSGALLAGFAGFLKAMFNIHEVVTTIMLNWTVWYLFKYIFTIYQGTLGGSGIASSASIPNNLLTVGNSPILIPILIALVSVVVVALLLSKTVFGFKVKAVGISQDASKYAGYNVKQKIIQAMLLSGGLAGLASFINVLTITPNISFATDNLPTIGYDSIAISLVAFNNPVGILFTSVLWGTLQSSGTSAASMYGVPVQLSALIFGVIVYFAAISVVFMNYSPLIRLRTTIAIFQSRKNRNKIRDLQKDLLRLRLRLAKMSQEKDVLNYKQDVTIAKNQAIGIFESSKRTAADKQELNQTLNNLKHNLHAYYKEYRQTIKNEIAKVSLEIQVLKKATYLNQLTSAKTGINRRHFEFVRQVENQALQEGVQLKNVRLVKKDSFKKAKDEKLNYVEIETKKAKVTYKQALELNRFWYEGQFGTISNYFVAKNSKIENNGEIKKYQVLLQNEISSLKAEYRLQKSQLTGKDREKKLIAEQKAMQKQITKLKKDFAKFKADKKAQIKADKKLYRDTKIVLIKRNEPSKLKSEYYKKNKIAFNQYNQTLAVIKENEILIRNKFDDQKSSQELSEAKNLLKSFQTKNHLAAKNVEQSEERIKAFEVLESKISKIYETTYTDYDSYAMIKQKYHFYLALSNEWENIHLEELVLRYQAIIDQANLENQKIIKGYDRKIKEINKEYKFQVKAIKNDANLQPYERQEQLVIQEDFYHDEVNSLVTNLESKFTTVMEVK